MWPQGTVQASEELLFDLRSACKGISGGASAEWTLSASKGHLPMLHASRLLIIPKVILRNEDAVEKLNIGVYQPADTIGFVKLYLKRELCRKPETLLRPGKGRISNDLLDWSKKLAGSAGDAEASWAWAQLMEDDFATFSTDIGSVASRFILRNGAVLQDVRFQQSEAGNDKIILFSCRVPIKYVRGPESIVKVDSGDDEEAEND